MIVYIFGYFPVLSLAVVPATFVAAHKFGWFVRELSQKTQDAAAAAASIAEVCLIKWNANISRDRKDYWNWTILHVLYAQESFGAIRTVRSFAQEEYEISRYSKKVDETLKLGLKQAVSSPFVDSCVCLSVYLLYLLDLAYYKF